ncbi:2-aminoethanethiol (cysteamine) dioxygenase a [Lepisosteus oculatus]|uniref:2-aminoethanethiol (cysteamine) dioxygenase a n=1 Tax=Lepisosteus oculatus TaxID=7918 RepID=W5NNX6_LEPOC|nr:PREDICTED: 2-aminoethanethiol dioxygenase [Lepisosteus oculatus]XP_015202532.1 PREDICTED: 2-aminoethanethiol dioxygenase [Lepisosteus oculatus]
MPRDNMTSLIQKIARQARTTFRNRGSSSIGENSKVFLENHSKLRDLLAEIRSEDLKIVPRKVDSAAISLPHTPPVTYMHICETDAFSMGVFLLKNGSSIPLHDHPGMNGMLKVLYGKVRISCFDKLDKPADAACEAQFTAPQVPYRKDALRRSVLRSIGEYTEESGPCILTPQKDNLHQIDAVDGPTAFLDILAPPYDPDDGRDCHYYKLLQPVSDNSGKKSESQEQQEVWLLEIPQPPDFWCGGESYPGPEVKL